MTAQIAYGFFAQTVILLVLYAALALLAALKFLPMDLLAQSMPYHRVTEFANTLLQLAIVSGLLGGGVYAVARNRQEGTLPHERWLVYTFWLWTALLFATFLVGLMGGLQENTLFGLPPVLDLGVALVIVLVVIQVGRSVSQWTAMPFVWASGMALSALCTLVSLIPMPDFLQDRALDTFASALNLNVAYVLAALALGFWLARRFSNVSQPWADMSLYTVAGLVALASIWLIASVFFPISPPHWWHAAGVLVMPVLYLILAAHSYRALADRNATVTLAAHWYGLSVLLLLLGPGLLGGLQSVPAIHQWTVGTRLSDLQATLTALAVVAIVIGVMNQAAAELRGENRRVTGLAPFWLVSFGMVGGGIALAGAGLAQTYVERILGTTYLDTQTLLVPLYALWIVGLLSQAVGIGIYALAFWLRRPAELAA